MDYLDFYFDGFDTPTAGVDISEEWTLSSGTTNYTFSDLAAFDSRRALRLDGTSIRFARSMATAHDYVLVGWRGWRYQSNRAAGNQWLRLSAGTTERVSLRCATANTGHMAVHLGGSATATLTCNDFQVLNANNYYELEIYRHAVDGFIGLYRDGNLMASFSGDTSAMASAVDNVSFGALWSGSGIYEYFRDIYFCGLSNWSAIGGNNLGPGETAILVPDADEAVEFTPSAGAVNYALVDDSPHDSDATYNVSGTVSEEDLFSHAGISTATRIFAVAVEYTARKTEAGTLAMLPVLKSGVTRSEGDAFVPSDTYRTRTGDVHLTDPADSGAWSEAKVNALQFGYANAAA